MSVVSTLFKNESLTTYRRIAFAGLWILFGGLLVFAYESFAAAHSVPGDAVVFGIRTEQRDGYEDLVYGLALPAPLSRQVWTLLDRAADVRVGSVLRIRMSKYYFADGYRIDRWYGLFQFSFIASLAGVLTAILGPLILKIVRVLKYSRW